MTYQTLTSQSDRSWWATFNQQCELCGLKSGPNTVTTDMYSLLHTVCCSDSPVLIEKCRSTFVQVCGGAPLS